MLHTFTISFWILGLVYWELRPQDKMWIIAVLVTETEYVPSVNCFLKSQDSCGFVKLFGLQLRKNIHRLRRISSRFYRYLTDTKDQCFLQSTAMKALNPRYRLQDTQEWTVSIAAITGWCFTSTDIDGLFSLIHGMISRLDGLIMVCFTKLTLS